jgi:hypothetical protein
MKRSTITSITQDAKDDTGMFVQFADGRTFREPIIVLEGEKVEQIRQGYACIWCFEELENAFPKQCPLCTFPVADMQTRLFARFYMGVEVPITPLEEKLAMLDEQDERDAYVKGKSISVPRSI